MSENDPRHADEADAVQTLDAVLGVGGVQDLLPVRVHRERQQDPPQPAWRTNREREMIYLTRHSTHFIYGYMEGRKEMFYLTTHSTHFILRLYGVRHMVKDHSDSEKGNPLPPHRLLLSINSKGSLICIIPETR